VLESTVLLYFNEFHHHAHRALLILFIRFSVPVLRPRHFCLSCQGRKTTQKHKDEFFCDVPSPHHSLPIFKSFYPTAGLMYMSRFVNWPCGRELGRQCRMKLSVEKWFIFLRNIYFINNFKTFKILNLGAQFPC
jgi:hypothetical protein